MPRKSTGSQRWAHYVATKNKPMEIFVIGRYLPNNTEDSLKVRVLVAGYKALQEGFGFGLGAHNITPCEYAEILQHLTPTSEDIESKLSTISSPMCLNDAYLGKRTSGRLVRLAYNGRKKKCDVLESIVLAHQYVLSEICLTAFAKDKDMDARAHGRSAHDLKTWSFCRYSIFIPALAGMQDFLKLVDSPVGSVTIGRDRSTIYAPDEMFPSEHKTLREYCWPNHTLLGKKVQNEATFLILTLLPSISGGLVAENMEKVGIYVTATEEIIRGHTGARGALGRYYEWVAPVMAGMKGKRVQTFFLGIGCSIILPSTCAFRLAAHCSEEVVLFVHCVRIRLRSGVQMPFLVRNKSVSQKDLQEYGNSTEVLQKRFVKDQDILRFTDWCQLNTFKDYGTLGTIPSLCSVPLNTKLREKIADPFYNLRLGTGGVREAYRRTPVIRIQIPTPGEHGNFQEEYDDLWMAGTGEGSIMIDDIPYGSFEYEKGEALLFCIIDGHVRPFRALNRARENSACMDNTSDSDSSSGSDSYDDDHSSGQPSNSGSSSSEYSSDAE